VKKKTTNYEETHDWSKDVKRNTSNQQKNKWH
jgi:hypothetical protein